jgi:hypothetical protein
VTSLPGIALSVARCVDCLEADAVPLWMAVANTVAIGGMVHAADWWREIVADTLAYLQVPVEDFDLMVAEHLAALAEAETGS